MALRELILAAVPELELDCTCAGATACVRCHALEALRRAAVAFRHAREPAITAALAVGCALADRDREGRR